jgi:hypothetical protein
MGVINIPVKMGGGQLLDENKNNKGVSILF